MICRRTVAELRRVLSNKMAEANSSIVCNLQNNYNILICIHQPPQKCDRWLLEHFHGMSHLSFVIVDTF